MRYINVLLTYLLTDNIRKQTDDKERSMTSYRVRLLNDKPKRLVHFSTLNI